MINFKDQCKNKDKIHTEMILMNNKYHRQKKCELMKVEAEIQIGEILLKKKIRILKKWIIQIKIVKNNNKNLTLRQIK